MMDNQLNNTDISDIKSLETIIHLLKNDKDYNNLSKSLALLEVQRNTTIQNLEKLAILKDDLSKKPSLALNKIYNHAEIGTSKLVTIEPLPDIDWSAYIINDGTENEPRASSSTSEIKEIFEEPWTVEEQLRLEKLLMKYPRERFKCMRYDKIAKALGTRTWQQVSSRVQMYSKKMKKVNSIKTIDAYSKKASKKIPSLRSRVNFNIFDDVDNLFGFRHIKVELDMQSKLKIFDEVFKDSITDNKNLVIHDDFTCSMCQSSPMLGTRWNCIDCSAIGINNNFCNDCILDTVLNDNVDAPHPISHEVTPIRNIQKNDDNIDNPVDRNYVPLRFNPYPYMNSNLFDM